MRSCRGIFETHRVWTTGFLELSRRLQKEIVNAGARELQSEVGMRASVGKGENQDMSFLI